MIRFVIYFYFFVFLEEKKPNDNSKWEGSLLMNELVVDLIENISSFVKGSYPWLIYLDVFLMQSPDATYWCCLWGAIW